MKRTKEKHEKELENEEGHKLFKHEMTDAMRIQGWENISKNLYTKSETNPVFSQTIMTNNKF